MKDENRNWTRIILWVVAIVAIVLIVIFAFGAKDYIGEEKAKSIALQKAGVKEADVMFERVGAIRLSCVIKVSIGSCSLPLLMLECRHLDRVPGEESSGGVMAKKKVYAVKKGSVTGIFHSWEECKAAVDGVSGAEYKGFLTEAEARRYLGEDKKHYEPDIPSNQVIAYVDGSYSHEILTYSFGCIILTPEGEVLTYSGNGKDPQSAAIRNVAGEMLGAMFAVKWAVKHQYAQIEIRYDYEGIEKWVTGAWKAKMERTQKYGDYMRRCARKIRISFTKVEAHTGDYYNEEADKLAKAALTEADGIPEIDL